MNKGKNLGGSEYLFPISVPNNILISFIGVIDSNAEVYLITQVEEYLDSIKCRETTKAKVMEIVIELLQNVLHHSPDQPLDEKIIGNTFQLERSKRGLIISTSNYILTRKIATLQKRIEYLNSLTPDELTSLHKDILGNGNSARETAGMGLIEIRRKSRNPILFMFAPPSNLDNKYSLFTVKVLV
jgi:hypothetical protein